LRTTNKHWLTPILLSLLLCAPLSGCGPDEAVDETDSGSLVDPDAGDSGAADAGDDNDVAQPDPLRLKFEPIAFDREVTAITDFAFIPGSDSELLLTRKDGEVLYFQIDGDTAEQLGSVNLAGVDDTHDCGLLSMAFDPNFEQNGHVYFGYCVAKGVNVISRHNFDASDLSLLNETTAEVIRVVNPDAEQFWHNIGSINFDADGYLWALFGENAHGSEAQNQERATGSLIRIKPTPDAEGRSWQPAPGNPFIGEADKHEAIYAWGLRSPWRGVIDQQGRYWIGDVGAAKFEEINVAVAPGQNFGWPDSEGPCLENCEGMTDPIIWWDRSADHPFIFEDPETVPTTRRACWVGLAYDAPDAKDRYDDRLDDKVLYGGFCTGWVRAASYDSQSGLTFDASIGHLEGVVAWSTASDGYAYVATYGSCTTFPYEPGALYRAVLK
jgi:glucose/arabinose dehydrogenase